ncbi:hypothetical protein HY086_03255 [Candidatus Gottesmanbacteria bacterium]|nr:hypothetical protein [Candidatus Gottesmanbacteria bacterium]
MLELFNEGLCYHHGEPGAAGDSHRAAHELQTLAVVALEAEIVKNKMDASFWAAVASARHANDAVQSTNKVLPRKDRAHHSP